MILAKDISMINSQLPQLIYNTQYLVVIKNSKLFEKKRKSYLMVEDIKALNEDRNNQVIAIFQLALIVWLHSVDEALSLNKANFFIEFNQSERTLSTLLTFRLNIAEKQDLYGLKASGYQALKYVYEASISYQHFIEIESINSNSWVGYGLALESRHQNMQAVSAFRAATQSQRIEPSLRLFAERRFLRLQG